MILFPSKNDCVGYFWGVCLLLGNISINIQGYYSSSKINSSCKGQITTNYENLRFLFNNSSHKTISDFFNVDYIFPSALFTISVKNDPLSVNFLDK